MSVKTYFFPPQQVNAWKQCFPLISSTFFQCSKLDKNLCGMRADRVYASREHFNRNRQLRILLSQRNRIEKAHHLHPQMILPCQNLLWLHTLLWHALVHELRPDSLKTHANEMRSQMIYHMSKYSILSLHKCFICFFKAQSITADSEDLLLRALNTGWLSHYSLIHHRKRHH